MQHDGVRSNRSAASYTVYNAELEAFVGGVLASQMYEHSIPAAVASVVGDGRTAMLKERVRRSERPHPD